MGIHNYLRSIGFKYLKKTEEMKKLIQSIIDQPDEKLITEDEMGNLFVELKKEYGDIIGIAVCGTYIDDKDFEMEYYYPYFVGSGVSTKERVEVNKRIDRNAYAGICDEMRIGVTLIFYLQNAVEYLKEYHSKSKRVAGNATISALSVEGCVVLPVYKNESQIKSEEKYSMNRNHLMAAARDGDEEAMESLTLEDIDTYSMISRRIMTEDILSIVDTYFMPYGMESDQYSIMGEILDCYEIENYHTKEKSYVLTLDSNQLTFDVCINQEDLLGEPAPGRRFKGIIWMQGKVHYNI